MAINQYIERYMTKMVELCMKNESKADTIELQTNRQFEKHCQLKNTCF